MMCSGISRYSSMLSRCTVRTGLMRRDCIRHIERLNWAFIGVNLSLLQKKSYASLSVPCTVVYLMILDSRLSHA